MSAIVIAHFPVADVDRAKRALASNASLLDEVTEDAKRLGCHHHRFLQADGELLVLDEWDSAEAFQGFFEGNAKVGRVTQAAGVEGPPRVEVFSSVDAPGTF
jgi:heme-degrading monooxygenase HmoA